MINPTNRDAWDLIMQSVLTSCCNPLNDQKLESWTTILEVTQSALRVAEANGKMNDSSLQLQMLYPFDYTLRGLASLLSYGVSEVQLAEYVLKDLLKFLQSNASLFCHTWDHILNLLQCTLKSTKDEQPRLFKSSALVKLTFANMEFICADCVEYQSANSLLHTIELLELYVLRSGDVNVSLTAIGLLWSFSDYLRKDHESSFDPADSYRIRNALLMTLLRISQECNADIQMSAAQTFFRVLQMDGASFSHDEWTTILVDAIVPLMGCAEKAPLTADFPGIVADGSIKTLTEFLGIISKCKDFELMLGDIFLKLKYITHKHERVVRPMCANLREWILRVMLISDVGLRSNLWQSTWTYWSSIFDLQTRTPIVTVNAVLVEYCALSELFIKSGLELDVFTKTHLEVLTVLLPTLCEMEPYTGLPSSLSAMTHLQTAVLKTIEQVQNINDPAFIMIAMDCYCSLIRLAVKDEELHLFLLRISEQSISASLALFQKSSGNSIIYSEGAFTKLMAV